MSRRAQRYALLAGALVTLLVLALDLTAGRSSGADGAPSRVTDTLRAAGATVTGPLLTTAARAFPPPADHEPALVRTSARLALTEEALRRADATSELLTSPTLTATSDSGHSLVLARVVGVGAPGPSGPQRLTLDVGSRDGVTLDQSVVAGAGLVGRTVRVGTTTSDVLILGASDLVVGARAGTTGLLGTVAPPTAADASRDPGQLTFAAISLGDLEPGEPVITVGSPDDVPFVAGIAVGTVATVDPDTGRLGRTAAVDPAVDIGTLDIVAVVIPQARPGDGD
jgi:rod shape-determining protein MreC